ncbi:hypothetical protein GALMADRAFT_761660 [Galerina marginata CBS 339.88]|uniref:Uncharacterized protein n=1 Tax=Galerina marginata (strain CBS 339.88) TaxID=685588 RepID=A0A067SP61_GALM3|nr:hypothetical protein GALMADRAFT_761660 [Galerina marginata CBS 339.88]
MTHSGDTSISSKMRLDSEWIFDLRTNPFDDSDDAGSDSSDAPHQNGTKKIDDLNGIDLSSREETVAYKPNPFSIAKINAAYRTKPHGGTSVLAASPLKVTATNSGQKTIMEGFKTQALRRGQLNLIPKVPLKPGLASGKVPTSQHQATRIQSTIEDASTTQTHSFPEPAANTNSIPNLAGEPEKVSTILPKLGSQPSVQPVDAHILTLEQHLMTPIPSFNENPGLSDSVNHLPPYARPLPNHDNRLRDCDLRSKPQSSAFSFSSPLRSLARDTISDFQDATFSQKYSSPIKPMLTPSQNYKFLNRMTRPSSSRRTSKPFEQIHTQATNRNSRAENPIVQQKHNAILRQQNTTMHEDASIKLETVQEPGPCFRDPRPGVRY